jgi:DNA polymerase I-like protein with 3'-5' exonuclease and polymerase domains
VWYSADASNIQLRIPAYEAGETELIEIFDHPERGPYYGSYHLVIFDTLHPELFAKHGKDCKTLFEDTWYQWVKNGNFARQFGAQPKKVDSTFRVQGGSDLIGNRFPRIDRLAKKYITYSNKHGYVETIPDKLLNCKRGYPLMTSRTQYGKISPTLPFCYHVAGSAQQWMGNAMVNCGEIINRWRRKDKYHVYTIIQVHDELVFDFPQEKIAGTHKPRIEDLRHAMEKCGDRINVPTPVNVERHDESWAVGVAI